MQRVVHGADLVRVRVGVRVRRVGLGGRVGVRVVVHRTHLGGSQGWCVG